ncbi:MAG TPA: PQQ-binding-like beta-propeller repeat protein [Thermoplasmata archaeon]|nr:PQQ-binding-like beta-propeller repeat protein [Thermoplasmata archaeon]
MRATLPTGFRRRGGLLLSGTVIVIVLLLALPSAGFAAPGHGGPPIRSPANSGPSGPALPHAPVVRSSADDWPELHQTPLLQGFAPNSPLTSLNAPKLGVAWATSLSGAALDSPVAAYDPVLHETLAYIGTESGNVLAVDLADGQIVWATWLGSPIRSTPLVYNGSVYIGTFTNPALVRLNATTGATECSYLSTRPFEGTPVEATPSGGIPTVYIGSEDDVKVSGAMLAINAGNCSLEWSFSQFGSQGGTSGSWDAASYTATANGTPVLLFGTADPDAAVYEINARSGTLIWRFQAFNPPPSVYDIGAGVTISPPGKNGFPQGVAYVPSKYGIMYALNLANGTPIWSTDFDQLAGIPNGTDGGRSTAALDGNNLIFGYSKGLFDLNALNGQLIWNYQDPVKQESIASPAIGGGHGSAIIATADIAGGLDVLSVVGPTQLYRYQTGGYITASPAIVGGNILLASTDGFLYDFDVGGGNDATLPNATISYPSQSSALSNPNGNLTVRGNATDPVGLAGVEVAIQSNGVGGPWWDGTGQDWVAGPQLNWATIASPGATTSSWSYPFPPARGGGAYVVTVYGVSSSGQSGIHTNLVGFGVLYSISGPHIQASQPYIPPGDSVVVNGAGFNKSEKVEITLPGSLLATVTASATGALPATSVKIPTKTSFGETSLIATGETSGKSASTALTVSNDWEEVGFDPSHTGYEPNDPALNFLVHPGGNYWVDLAWLFTVGSGFTTSPAIVDGIAYVGDQAGHLYAVDIHNAGMIWNWTLPSGQPIDGSPAVDPNLGLVFIGANDGTVDAVHVQNGTTDWSATVGGDVSAPIFAGGVVYVTTSGGGVDALNESTGAGVWSVTLPSKVTSAATLNSTAQVLLVGQSNGNETELSTLTGTTVWNYKTGGAVEGSATLSGGLVFFGSTDKNVYALNQSTGTKIWSYTAAATVTGTGTLTDHYTFNSGQSEFAIGASNGKLYVLSASTGALFYTVSVHGSIVAVSSAEGIFIMETAKGQVSAARSYTPLVVWKYNTTGSLTTAPAIVDGTIYVAGANGSFYAFTTFGQAPD